MRYYPIGFLISLLSFALPAQALSLWHSNTVWAGQGQCAATLTFDSGLDKIEELELLVSAVSAEGESIELGKIQLETFGESSAERYSSALLEHQLLCDEETTLFINQAAAIINGEYIDLIQMRQLEARKFKPFFIDMY